MSKENEKNVAAAAAAEAPKEDETGKIVFSKAYRFENKEYLGVDLSGLDNLTAEDMIAADKFVAASGSFSPMPELSIGYALFIASCATDLPIEFFRRLPPKDAIKIKNQVTNFFYGED